MDPKKIDMLRQNGFVRQADRVEQGRCPLCDVPIDVSQFRDALSRREFAVSAMCQACQDEVFGPDGGRSA